ncbi:MAG: class I SAM-dependent methyltransferase [Solirubrobacterales bacterium]
MSSAAVWHEVECGGYAADLDVWRRLAEPAAGGVLELGAGAGRVALHLARHGCEVWAVDSDPELIEALVERASSEGLRVEAVCADVRTLDLERRFELVIAPMQLVQMLGGRGSRLAALERIARHLEAGGRLAAAIVERPGAAVLGAGSGMPDVRERDGWMFSSVPTVLPASDGGLEIRRSRQAVSPAGGMSEEQHTERLAGLDAESFETEAAQADLLPRGRLSVEASDGYLGSTVVVSERV